MQGADGFSVTNKDKVSTEVAKAVRSGRFGLVRKVLRALAEWRNVALVTGGTVLASVVGGFLGYQRAKRDQAGPGTYFKGEVMAVKIACECQLFDNCAKLEVAYTSHANKEVKTKHCPKKVPQDKPLISHHQQ